MRLFTFLFLSLFAISVGSAQELVGNKGTQTLNPDISVIVDSVGGFWNRRPLSLAGDDPDLGGTSAGRGGGFTIQEAEVAFSSNVDPFLRADMFLTIPNGGKPEVEEAYLTTTSLPWILQPQPGLPENGTIIFIIAIRKKSLAIH